MIKNILIFAVILHVVLAQVSQGIPCGLPPFVDKMPLKQSQELKKVWSGYESGKDCRLQQNATFSIVASLTDQERATVFPQHQANHVVDAFETIPAFIRSLSPEIRKEFDFIWTDVELTDAQKYEKMEQLANSKFNAEQKNGFAAWMAGVKKSKAAVEARIEKLSTEARELLKELSEVRSKEQKLLRKMTPEMARELHGLM